MDYWGQIKCSEIPHGEGEQPQRRCFLRLRSGEDQVLYPYPGLHWGEHLFPFSVCTCLRPVPPGHSDWALGNDSSTECGWALEQTPQSSGHSPRLLEFKECLDNALRHKVWVLSGPMWSHELNSKFLVGPFQLQIFYVFPIFSPYHVWILLAYPCLGPEPICFSSGLHMAENKIRWTVFRMYDL